MYVCIYIFHRFWLERGLSQAKGKLPRSPKQSPSDTTFVASTCFVCTTCRCDALRGFSFSRMAIWSRAFSPFPRNSCKSATFNFEFGFLCIQQIQADF